MKHSFDRKLIAAALLCGAGLAMVPAADAVAFSENWYSRTKPLLAEGDGDAAAYGTVYTKNSYVKNHTYYRDLKAGGNGVYTETGYKYLQAAAGGGTTWTTGNMWKDQSARTTSSAWQDQYDADDYTNRTHEGAVRVYYKVCEDQAGEPDACSRNPYILISGI